MCLTGNKVLGISPEFGFRTKPFCNFGDQELHTPRYLLALRIKARVVPVYTSKPICNIAQGLPA